MLDQDEDDPYFIKYVNKRVTLDMIATEELIQELADRDSLILITARRNVPRETYIKADFYPAMHAILSCDLAKEIQSQELMGEGIKQTNTDLEFSASIVVLKPIEEGNVI